MPISERSVRASGPRSIRDSTIKARCVKLAHFEDDRLRFAADRQEVSRNWRWPFPRKSRAEVRGKPSIYAERRFAQRFRRRSRIQSNPVQPSCKAWRDRCFQFSIAYPRLAGPDRPALYGDNFNAVGSR